MESSTSDIHFRSTCMSLGINDHLVNTVIELHKQTIRESLIFSNWLLNFHQAYALYVVVFSNSHSSFVDFILHLNCNSEMRFLSYGDLNCFLGHEKVWRVMIIHKWVDMRNVKRMRQAKILLLEKLYITWSFCQCKRTRILITFVNVEYLSFFDTSENMWNIFLMLSYDYFLPIFLSPAGPVFLFDHLFIRWRLDECTLRFYTSFL